MRILHIPRHERVAMVRYGRIENQLRPRVRVGLDAWRLVPTARTPERRESVELDESVDGQADPSGSPQVIAEEDGRVRSRAYSARQRRVAA